MYKWKKGFKNKVKGFILKKNGIFERKRDIVLLDSF